jgi:hypothetical protein
MGAAAGVLFHTADMVAEIIDFLPEQDLESCTGVSRLFRALAMARLHRYVCLPSPKSAAVLTREGLEEYATTIELEQHDLA